MAASGTPLLWMDHQAVATMIGFIGGAGIVVPNSVILVDFIELRLAVVEPGAMRVNDQTSRPSCTAAGIYMRRMEGKGSSGLAKGAGQPTNRFTGRW